jgi:ribonuclease P protein subunit RPR2
MLKREKRLEKKIAKERIEILFKLMEKVKDEDYELARRYVELARRIAMKYRLKLPKEFKLKFCKKCLYPYTSGRFRVRIAKSRVIITCLNCGFVKRVPIRPKDYKKYKRSNKKGKG